MRKTLKHRKMIQTVYWINLDRSTERRKRMLDVFKHSFFDGLQLHRISALDGKDTTFLSTLKQIGNVELHGKISPLEYACTLSHIKAMQSFVQSGEEVAIICEDDVSMDLNPTKRQLETCIRKAPPDWEILQLYYFIGKENDLITPLYSENKINNAFYSTLAYVIRRKGAIRFLQELIPNRQIQFDPEIGHTSDTYLYHKMKTYVYKYPLFSPTSIDSTLHPSHLKGHRKSLKRMKHLLKKIK